MGAGGSDDKARLLLASEEGADESAALLRLRSEFRQRVAAAVAPLVNDRTELDTSLDCTRLLVGFARQYLHEKRELILRKRPDENLPQPRLALINAVRTCVEGLGSLQPSRSSGAYQSVGWRGNRATRSAPNSFSTCGRSTWCAECGLMKGWIDPSSHPWCGMDSMAFLTFWLATFMPCGT
jgi:hypothetical protein